MNDTNSFGQTAKNLARNPLGVIALFIVLIYGVASLVTAFSGSLASHERLPLIWFLVLFPFAVLSSFTWLVATHSKDLFAPSDYKSEENYVKMQLAAVASLTAASAKSEKPTPETDLQKIIDAVRASIIPLKEKTGKRNHVLWIDDQPDNNIYERKAFEAVGIQFTLAKSTAEAEQLIKSNKYAAIISDMGRQEGEREGYVLLEAIRRLGDKTPYFIYAGSTSPEHTRETYELGGQGNTNNPQELFSMVMKAIISTQ